MYKTDFVNLSAVQQFAAFKANIIQNALACKLFTHNYPTMIEHIREEALFYLDMLERLNKREEVNLVRNAVELESLWNHIMGEHAEFNLKKKI